jgi:hypothetical protein
MATVAGAALAGALLGADLYAAKEFGFAVGRACGQTSC